MLEKKNQATKLKYKKALIKLQSNSPPPKCEARGHLKYNVQPDRSIQITVFTRV